MRVGPRKSAEIAARAIQMRHEGLTWNQICKKLRVKWECLRKWVDKAGYQPASIKASPANLARARQLRAQGVCWKLVEREIGVAWKTLQWAICAENRKARDGQ